MDNPWADDADDDNGDDNDHDKWDRPVDVDVVDPDVLIHNSRQVCLEIWPPSGDRADDDSWKSGLDSFADITALMAQLVPSDPILPQAVQFSATATAKAMNDALKSTRHLPLSVASPLSRLLASKGSLDWIKPPHVSVADTAHVGWRVLEKEDRVISFDESKSKKAPGGLLSFWNRRATPVDSPSERVKSPARSSLEGANPASSPPPPPPPIAVAVPPPPSAVSRFLNRFSRAKSTQHSSLALSPDDIEFLSDIVPSAVDPLGEDLDDTPTGASNSSPLPPILPPPIPPPPKQSSRPPSALGLGTLDRVIGTAQTASNVPVLAPPPSSPKPAFSRTQIPFVQPTLQRGSQSDSRPHSPFTLLPPNKVPASLPLLPLLSPPPVSPPQTPRPSTFSPMIVPAQDTSLFHGAHESDDDEFSAFESFPPASPTPFPSLDSHPHQRSPTPPSPPPRRTYERTHYPSSSSTSSILSPASQTSVDQLCSTKSFISASLDSFDEFVSVPQAENNQLAPSLPPLPTSARRQPPPLDTLPSRVRHAHTSSQTSASPTARTSLLHDPSSGPSVSDAEHRRTQSLVNHAAARGGLLWPNSPGVDEPSARAIPPPPSSTSPPKSLIGDAGFDLLGDGDGFGALSAPLTGGPAGGPTGSKNPLQPPPILSFTSMDAVLRPVSTISGALQPAKPKQTGGLSAQDLSFFEGL